MKAFFAAFGIALLLMPAISGAETRVRTALLDETASDAASAERVRKFLCVDRSSTQGRPCPDIVKHVRVRLGVPEVVRGPFDPESDTGGDSGIVFLPKSNGTFNAYSGNQGTYRLPTPNLTSGLRTANSSLIIPKNVLGSGPKAVDACGSWLESVRKLGSLWYALVHNEGPCDYSIVNTYETMSLWRSADEGDTWTPVGPGTILSASPKQAPWAHVSGRIAGVGDFNWIPGPNPDPDGSGQQYLYAYGGRYVPEWGTVIARAPINDFGPGNWLKWHNGGFTSPGVGGEDTNITMVYPTRSFPGRTPVVLKGIANVGLIGQDHVQCPNPDGVSAHDVKGLTLALSHDMVTFDVMCPEPFLNYDEQEFNARTPASKDLYVYPVINNDRDGGREIDPGHGYLYYTWVRPGEGLGTRYIVATPIQITLEQSPQSPQAGVSLVRYYNRTTSTIRTTAAPVAPQDGFAYDAHLGHVMTAPPSIGEPVVKIEECYRTKGNVTDYGIGWDGHCVGNGLTRIRSTGWLFKAALPGTKPIYSCLDQNGHGLYASNLANCEGHGSVLNLLGHALAN